MHETYYKYKDLDRFINAHVNKITKNMNDILLSDKVDLKAKKRYQSYRGTLLNHPPRHNNLEFVH